MKEGFDSAMLGGADLKGLVASGAVAGLMGGVFLALGRRRNPEASETRKPFLARTREIVHFPKRNK